MTSTTIAATSVGAEIALDEGVLKETVEVPFVGAAGAAIGGRFWVLAEEEDDAVSKEDDGGAALRCYLMECATPDSVSGRSTASTSSRAAKREACRQRQRVAAVSFNMSAEFAGCRSMTTKRNFQVPKLPVLLPSTTKEIQDVGD